jgi:hypothetical protein
MKKIFLKCMKIAPFLAEGCYPPIRIEIKPRLKISSLQDCNQSLRSSLNLLMFAVTNGGICRYYIPPPPFGGI